MEMTVGEVKPPYIKLKLLLVRRNIKHKDLAEAVGMKPSQFSQKINKNKSNFTLDEASKISDYLDVNAQEYFFNSDFSIMGNEKDVN